MEITGTEYRAGTLYLTVVNTGWCNLSCPYCLSRNSCTDTISAEICSAINNVTKTFKRDIYVFGGETFFDKDIVAKMAVFSDPITYQTNGTFDLSRCIPLLKAGDKISFTIHQGVHLKRVIANISLCQDAGVLKDVDYMYCGDLKTFKVLKRLYPKMGFQVPFQYVNRFKSEIYRYDDYFDLEVDGELSTQLRLVLKGLNLKGATCDGNIVIDLRGNVYKCEEHYFKGEPYTTIDNFYLNDSPCDVVSCRVLNSTRKIHLPES